MHNKEAFLDDCYSGYGIKVCRVSPSDLPSLRRWRNADYISSQMRDSSHITPKKQRLWYERISRRVDQVHWVVWCKGCRTGYMNLKGTENLRGEKFLEGGLYIGQSKVRHGLLGYATALMQLELVFEHLDVESYRTSYRNSNVSAHKFNQDLGYAITGESEGFTNIEIKKPEYLETKNRLSRYF